MSTSLAFLGPLISAGPAFFRPCPRCASSSRSGRDVVCNLYDFDAARGACSVCADAGAGGRGASAGAPRRLLQIRRSSYHGEGRGGGAEEGGCTGHGGSVAFLSLLHQPTHAWHTIPTAPPPVSRAGASGLQCWLERCANGADRRVMGKKSAPQRISERAWAPVPPPPATPSAPISQQAHAGCPSRAREAPGCGASARSRWHLAWRAPGRRAVEAAPCSGP